MPNRDNDEGDREWPVSRTKLILNEVRVESHLHSRILNQNEIEVVFASKDLFLNKLCAEMLQYFVPSCVR